MAKQKTVQPDKEQFEMLRALFNELYVEIDEMKKKKPDGVVNAFKVERINRVLKPLYDLMKDEPFVSYLELVQQPSEEKTGRGTIIVETGLTYSDVMIILSQYKGSMNQFWRKHYDITFGFGN